MRPWAVFFLLLFLGVVVGALGWVVFTQLRARRSGLPAPSWRSYVPFLNSGVSSGGFSNIPTPRSSNPIEWVRDRVNALRQGRNRTAQGNYEEAGSYGLGAPSAYGGAGPGPRRARGMDPDGAWDTRVGNEADAYDPTGPGGYYEEQELGLAPTPGLDDPYGNSGGTAMPAYGEGPDARGRSKSRDPPGAIGLQRGLDTSYDEEMARAGHAQQRLADSNNPFSDSHEAGSLTGVSPRPTVDPSAGQSGKGKVGGGSQESSPTERRSMFRESL